MRIRWAEASPGLKKWGGHRLAGADLEVPFGGHFMASAGARAYMGVWGRSPQWGPGAKPLVGGQGAKPPEADDILTFENTN